MNSVSCSVDASAKPTKREISYDLAGLDFTASQSSTEERAVLRRSARGDAMPSNGSKSNNRVGIVHDDQDFSDHSVKHSVSCQDKLLSGKSSESESEAKAGINGTEGQHVTSLSLDDGSQPMNGRKQSFGRKSCAPEAPPRNVTALLRSKSRNANDQTASVNNPPMLRPKPANIGRVVTNNQSSVTTGELSVDNQLPVTLVDWKLEAERLQTRLTVVEKERDDALARAKELERQLAILKNDMQARQQQGN